MTTEPLIDALPVIAAYLLLNKPNSTIWLFTGGRITSMSTETSAKLDAVTRVLIMGAAGRDFHLFNVCFRDNPAYRVVAFTAAQIPGIENRRYPPSLSGKLYPRRDSHLRREIP